MAATIKKAGSTTSQIQEKIDQLQAKLNNGEVDIEEIKSLIHLFNLRGSVLEDLFKQSVYLRRKWRKEKIDPDLLGTHLTFLRRACYGVIKLRRHLK